MRLDSDNIIDRFQCEGEGNHVQWDPTWSIDAVEHHGGGDEEGDGEDEGDGGGEGAGQAEGEEQTVH